MNTRNVLILCLKVANSAYSAFSTQSRIRKTAQSPSPGRDRATWPVSEGRFLVDGEDFGANGGNTLYRCALALKFPCSLNAE